MTAWRIWRADNRDANALAALEEQAFGDRSWGRESVLATFKAPNVVVEFGGLEQVKPLGFLIWRNAADEAEILSVGVSPDARRKGLAGALLQHLFKSTAGQGVRQLFLEVDSANEAAIGLYQHFGFARVAERRSYYRNGADAIIMRKMLIT